MLDLSVRTTTGLRQRGETLLALAICVACGSAIVLAGDLPTQYRAALLVVVIGLSGLAVIPSRRITLVAAWVFIHTLSIEKVFIVGQPLLPEFIPPTIVISASDVILLLLVLSLFLENCLTGRKAWYWPAAATPFAVLVVWTVLVCVVQNPSVQGSLVVVHRLKMLLFFVTLSSAIRTRNDVIVVLVAVGLTLAIQACIVGIVYATGRPLTFLPAVENLLLRFSSSTSGEHMRATGTMGHVNQEALLLTLFVLPVLGLLAARRYLWRIAAAAAIGLVLLALVFTYSRSGWVSITVGIIAVGIVALRKHKIDRRIWVYVWAVLPLVAIILGIYAGPILDRLLVGDEGATASRKRAAIRALELTARHPILGVGPGGFITAELEMRPLNRRTNTWLAPRERGTELPYDIEAVEAVIKDGRRYIIPLVVHNKYLLILAELGVVGLAIFCWFQWRVFKHALGCLRTNDTVLLWAGLGIVGAFWASQCYMMLDLLADDKTVALLLFVTVLAIAVDRVNREQAARGGNPG